MRNWLLTIRNFYADCRLLRFERFYFNSPFINHLQTKVYSTPYNIFPGNAEFYASLLTEPNLIVCTRENGNGTGTT